MATTIWKGHLTFGLVSIPVKLYRAARPEKVSFRQLHAATGTRVRQALIAETGAEPEPELTPDEPSLPRKGALRRAPEPEPFVAPAREPIRSFGAKVAPIQPEPVPDSQPREIARSEIAKGYEYAEDRYVVLTREELAAITPQTAREMQILEFVQLSEVDPIYYETSYYLAPDKSGERAYSLLFEALRQSGLVGVAQIAMHNREHVVIIRPGRRGITLHTMFYESEIRKEDEYSTDVSAVVPKELELSLLLVRNLTTPFEPGKYRDTYREKLEALVQAKIQGNETVQPPASKPAPVVDILEALQRSLQATGGVERMPPAKEQAPSPASSGRSARRRSGHK